MGCPTCFSTEALVGAMRDEGGVVLMEDERIRHRTAEHEVLRSSEVRAFCLTSGNLPLVGRRVVHGDPLGAPVLGS
jgi:hypothetical protein